MSSSLHTSKELGMMRWLVPIKIITSEEEIEDFLDQVKRFDEDIKSGKIKMKTKKE